MKEYEAQNAEYKRRAKKLGTDNDRLRGKDYDQMDYGDEANDDEEARYAKEMAGSDDEEDGEEESVEVVPLAREFSRRGNRG